MKRKPITGLPTVDICHDRPFFNRATGRRFDVQAAADVAEIDLYDEIGYWGVTAAAFRKTLNSIKSPSISLRINSPGGDVFDGIAMFNDLLDHPADVTVQITGLAASAASVIAMAGDRVEIAPNAFIMIHNAWALAIGDRNDMAQMGDILGQIDGALAETYAARTGEPVDDMAALMDAETWMKGEAAVDEGFADATTGDAVAASAHFDLSIFHKTPAELRTAPSAGPATKRDYERALRDAGVSKSAAAAMVAGGFEATQGRRDAWAGSLLSEFAPLLKRRATL